MIQPAILVVVIGKANCHLIVNKGYSEAEIVDICGFHKKTIKKVVLA
ncbi:hypothetical protein [Cysteiniphilum sp. JM-1]|nr:hypothetical protein [Cysteiniphilum sp. JM-1]